MSFLKSPHQAQNAAAVLPMYTGLQLNTSTNTLPIPIVYGMCQTAVNVIYYNNFTPVPEFSAQQSGGKGGVFGGGGGSTYQVVGWYYTADMELALCEGPISGINQVWQGQNVWLYGAGSPNPNGWTGLQSWSQPSSLFVGNASQAAWSYLSGVNGGIGYGSGGPGYAIPYSSTAYLAASAFSLGTSASVGTLRFEVCGRFYGTGWNGIDADPALVVQDFLTNAQYGAGYPSANIDLSWLLAAVSGPDSSTQTYCHALGIVFSPQVAQFETAASILTRWCQIMNVGAVRSGTLLRFIPYGDMNIEGNGVTWTAPATAGAVYSLNDNAFVYHEGEDPVQVSRVDPRSLFNVTRIEVLNRAGVNVAAALVTAEVSNNLAIMQNIASRGLAPGAGSYPQPQGQPQYEATPIEARDLSQVLALGGIRVGPTVTLHEICDLGVAATVAQILLQRQLYIRTTFKFSLSWEYCLLDPMDIVAITDYNLGLVNKLVRITEIEENDNGELDITAEDLTIGVSTPAPNVASGASNGIGNAAVGMDPVDSYLIWEPPVLLTNGPQQLWVGASGGTGGVADPNWGGCNVWISVDGGTTYGQVAKITNVLQQGVLTAPFGNNTGFDTTDTMSVDMTVSGMPLIPTTDASAQSGFQNLCLVNGELLAFATATLTSANHYNLTRIQRGMFGSSSGAHAPGDSLTMLQNVAKLVLPAQTIGQVLRFKFQSFNIYGGAVQALSACTPYPYTVNGSGYSDSNQLVTSTLTVTASGASVLTGALIPVDAWVFSITATVTSAVGGATSFNIDPQYLPNGGGSGGSSGLYGNCGASLGNTHTQSFGGNIPIWLTASGIELTAVGGSFSGGTIQVSATYCTVS